MRLSELQLKKDLLNVGVHRPNLDRTDTNSGLKDAPGKRVTPLFQKYGWNLLGHGVEGAVGEHPTKNMVLKVFVKDSSYKDFVTLVKDHPNPHFPKFHKYVREVPGTKFSYVLMEKLQPATDQMLYKKYLSEMYVLDIEAVKYDVPGCKMIRHGVYANYLNRGFINWMNEGDPENPYPDDVWDELNGKPDDAWFVAAEALMYTASILNTSIDLHYKNFMLRDETLVIIDPYYGGS